MYECCRFEPSIFSVYVVFGCQEQASQREVIPVNDTLEEEGMDCETQQLRGVDSESGQLIASDGEVDESSRAQSTDTSSDRYIVHILS